MIRIAAGPFLLLLALAAPAHGQTLRGQVLDATTSEPISAVRVTALSESGRVLARVRSGTDGTFELMLRSPGPVRLVGERAGYEPARSERIPVASREEVDLELRMSAEPMGLEPVFVTARQSAPRVLALVAAGFYEREARGFGTFLNRHDIGVGRSANLGQVLGRQPGMQLFSGRQGRQLVYFTRSQMGPGAPCIPVIFVDGVKIVYEDINHIINPENVDAVEMYRSRGEIPAEFFSNEARCGVLLVWSRSSP